MDGGQTLGTDGAGGRAVGPAAGCPLWGIAERQPQDHSPEEASLQDEGCWGAVSGITPRCRRGRVQTEPGLVLLMPAEGSSSSRGALPLCPSGSLAGGASGHELCSHVCLQYRQHLSPRPPGARGSVGSLATTHRASSHVRACGHHQRPGSEATFATFQRERAEPQGGSVCPW